MFSKLVTGTMLLLVVTSSVLGQAGDAAVPWQDNYTLVLVDSISGDHDRHLALSIQNLGGRASLIVPPHVILGQISPSIRHLVADLPGVRLVTASELSELDVGFGDPVTLSMVAYFNEVVTGRLARRLLEASDRAKLESPEPLAYDAREAPAIDYWSYLENLKLAGPLTDLPPDKESELLMSGGVGGRTESMLGSTWVSLFLLESDGSVDPNTYDWDESHRDYVISEMSAALQWWHFRALELYEKVATFVLYPYLSHRPECRIGYEPILHSSDDEELWVNEVMDNMYFPSGSMIDRVSAFNRGIRLTQGVDRAFSVFVAYNPPPAPDRFTDGRAAWAYMGGPHTSILYRSFSWPFNKVSAHETGHIFWACDEYCQPDYYCCTTCGQCNPLRPYANNGNCESCNPASVPCMMRHNELDLCSFTPLQIGWDGPDEPTLFNPVDGVLLDDATPTFLWSECVGSVRYHLQVDNDPAFTSPEIEDSGILITSYTPSTPLENDTYYWRVRSGDSVNWSPWTDSWFQVEALPLPTIACCGSGMTPRAGTAGAVVTITGSNFGSLPGQVVFSWSQPADVLEWSDTLIRCTVPAGAKSGYVRVKTGAGFSNPKYFKVGTAEVIYCSDASSLYWATSGPDAHTLIIVCPGVYLTHLGDIGQSDVQLVGDCGAEVTIVDGEGAPNRRMMGIFGGVDSSTVIDGLTFRRGRMPDGAGIRVASGTPIISNCIFDDNDALTSVGQGGALHLHAGSAIVRGNLFKYNDALVGGAIFMGQATPLISQNVFLNNSAGSGETNGGGAIYIVYSQGQGPQIQNNTFDGNYAGSGAAVFNYEGGGIFDNNIIANSSGGCAVFTASNCNYGWCNCYWNNQTADLCSSSDPDCDITLVNDNFAADPLWCSPFSEEYVGYGLNGESPCANNPNCGLVGALPVMCGTAPVTVDVTGPEEGETWYVDSTGWVIWNSECNTGIDSVAIYLSRDGGNTFMQDTTLVGDPGEVEVPVGPPTSLECKVKVEAFTTPYNTGFGLSPSFSIVDTTRPSVTLLSPTAEDVWHSLADPDTIRWIVDDNVGLDHVEVEYSIDEAHEIFCPVFTSTSPYDSLFAWSVPCVYSDSASTVIRLCAYDNSLNVSCESVAFTIVNAECCGTFPGATCLHGSQAVEPTNIDFGTVAVGSHADSAFTIRNTVGGLLVGSVSESCDHYSIASGGGDYNLGACESVTVTVRFEPVSAGVQNCTIETGNDLCEDVSCTGEGEDVSAVVPHEFWSSWKGDHAEVKWVLGEVDPDLNLTIEISRRRGSSGGYKRIEDPDVIRDGNQFTFRDNFTEPDEIYAYRVSILDHGRLLVSFGVELVTPVSRLVLYQNQPNPVNGSAEIRFAMPAEGYVQLEVYDISGRRIRTLADHRETAGRHSAVWDGRDSNGKPVASGVYLYRLKMGGETLTRTCALVR